MEESVAEEGEVDDKPKGKSASDEDEGEKDIISTIVEHVKKACTKLLEFIIPYDKSGKDSATESESEESPEEELPPKKGSSKKKVVKDIPIDEVVEEELEPADNE